MSIKLLALDLDGTLLDSKKNMPSDFIPWVKNHRDIKTVIASGRQYHTIVRDFPEGRENLTIVAENGALVYDKEDMIYINSMTDEDVISSLDRVLTIPGAIPIVCGVNTAYINKVNQEVYNQTVVYYAKIEQVDDLYKYIGKDRVLKVAVFFANRLAEEHLPELQNISDRVSAILSGERWVDIANKEVNKGLAIGKLQEIFNIDRKECAAFGDYLNDYTMLQACEESYCMENGHPDLKAIAKYIAPSNDDNGVMKVIGGDSFLT